MNAATLTPRRMADALLSEGLIDDDQYRRGVEEFEHTGRPLSRIFVEMGAIEEEDKIRVLQTQCHCDVADLEGVNPSAEALRLVPREVCRLHHVAPVRIQDDRLVLATEDPMDFEAIRAVESVSSMAVEPLLAHAQDIQRFILGAQPAPTAPRPDLRSRLVHWLLSPLLALLPLLLFYGGLYYSDRFQVFWSHLGFDVFERTLFFALAMCLWASFVYWMDGAWFDRRGRRRAGP